VSAGHVMDVFIKKPLFVGTASTWHQIIGDFRATTISPGKTREDDPLDYAFLPVSNEDAAALDGCHFLTAEQIALREEIVFAPPFRNKYLALGWPLNRLNFVRKEKATEPENLAFTGVIAPQAAYVRHHRDPRLHILIEFDKKGMIGRGGGPQLPPSFHGLSGGGIFTLPGVTRLGDMSPPRLVGLTIETWPAEDLYVGTRIDLISEALSATA